MKKGKISMYDVMKQKRNSWGTINPVTRIMRDRKKYTRKKKYIDKEE